MPLFFLTTTKLVFSALIFFTATKINAESKFRSSLLLSDKNDDGEVRYLGFGDSITFGVGDGTAPGEPVSQVPFTDGSKGYIARLTNWVGISAINGGVPGEVFTTGGIYRLPKEVNKNNPDIVGIFEGANDAIFQVSIEQYERYMQRAVNYLRASGKTALLITLPKPCCNRSGSAFFTSAYSSATRNIASINQVPLVDLERGWDLACGNDGASCTLFNLPEGLHPNIRGYDLISQMIAGALYGLDVFDPEESSVLANMLGIPEDKMVLHSTISLLSQSQLTKTLN
jgi:lysophospholipase L1-like esterase